MSTSDGPRSAARSAPCGRRRGSRPRGACLWGCPWCPCPVVLGVGGSVAAEGWTAAIEEGRDGFLVVLGGAEPPLDHGLAFQRRLQRCGGGAPHQRLDLPVGGG